MTAKEHNFKHGLQRLPSVPSTDIQAGERGVSVVKHFLTTPVLPPPDFTEKVMIRIRKTVRKRKGKCGKENRTPN